MKFCALLLSFLLALPACAATRLAPQSSAPIDTISFRVDVDDESADGMIAALEVAKTKRPAGVLVLIDSTGGSVAAGWRIIRAIEEAKAVTPVHCLVDGEADSMAFFILQACTTRGMTSVSKLLSHQPYFRMGPGVMRITDLQSLLNDLQTMLDQAEILASTRMGMPLAEYHERNQADWWMSSISARRFNAVDYVVSSVAAVRESLQLTGTLPK